MEDHAAKPIPGWDVQFGELDDDRKGSTAPNITFRPQPVGTDSEVWRKVHFTLALV